MPHPHDLCRHRAQEFQRRLAGESYEAIAASGAGVRSTVNATRSERDETLEKLLATRLEVACHGCTTVEVKAEATASRPPRRSVCST